MMTALPGAAMLLLHFPVTFCSFGTLLCTACAGCPENSNRIDGCHHTPSIRTTTLRVSQLTVIVSRGKLVDTWTAVYRGPNFPTELYFSRRSRRPRPPRHHFQRSSGREPRCVDVWATVRLNWKRIFRGKTRLKIVAVPGLVA